MIAGSEESTPVAAKPPAGSAASTDLSRRQFLAGVAAATGALALGGCGDGGGGHSRPRVGPAPEPRRLRHRARHRRDDGESLLRSLPRLVAGCRRDADRPRVHRQARRHAADLSARAELPELPVRRSRPFLRGRSRAVQRRRQRRLAACLDGRSLSDRLLHARRSRLLRQRGAGVDDRRPVLRRDPRPDLPEPVLPARRTDRPSEQYARRLHAPDDLGPAGRQGTERRPTTTATCRFWRCGALGSPRSASPSTSFSTMPAPATCRTSPTSIRASSARTRASRTTIIRSPTSAMARCSSTRSTTP